MAALLKEGRREEAGACMEDVRRASAQVVEQLRALVDGAAH
jgi:hypothetical protein